MISAVDYFGAKITHHDCTAIRRANAETLLARVNALLAEACEAGAYDWPIDPDTGTNVSGTRGGAGDGGFRLSTSTTGRPGSAHKEAEGVDVYDRSNWLDSWLSGFDDEHGGNSKLEQHGLYREHPSNTLGSDDDRHWCHLQTRRPGSGKRTFKP